MTVNAGSYPENGSMNHSVSTNNPENEYHNGDAYRSGYRGNNRLVSSNNHENGDRGIQSMRPAVVTSQLASPPATIPATIRAPAPTLSAPAVPSANVGGTSSFGSSSGLAGMKVVGLGGSKWANPEAAAKAVYRPIEQFFNDQDKAETHHNRRINGSSLCQPRAHVPTALHSTQTLTRASAPTASLQLSHEQVYASMRNANPQTSAATTYFGFQATQTVDEFRTKVHTDTPQSFNASASTPPSTGGQFSASVRSITPQSIATTTIPILPPSLEQVYASMRKVNPQASIVVASNKSQSFEQFRTGVTTTTSCSSTTSSQTPPQTRHQITASAHSTAPQTSTMSIPMLPPSHEKVTAASQVASVRAPAAISSQGDGCVASRNYIPHYLQRALGPSTSPCPPHKISTPNSSRHDSTDLIVRRMVGRALGVDMQRKEDVRSIAIDTALKESAKERKASWGEIRKNLPKGDDVQDDMDKVEQGDDIAVADQKENTKERVQDEGKETRKNMEAFMAAWKSGKVWTGKDSK